MKKTMLLLLGFTLLFALAGCGSGGNNETAGSGTTNAGTTGESDKNAEKAEEPKNVKLRFAWWGGQPRHDYTLKVIEMYEKKYPNVNIEPEFANYDDYWKKLAPQAAANELPDIIQMDISYLSQYGMRGQLEDLTPYLSNIINVSDISDNAVAGGKVGDNLYGFNAGVNVVNFQYDPALLKKIGVDKLNPDWTWEEYITLANKAKAAGLFFDTGMRPEVFFGYYLRTKGQHLYNADGTALGYEDDKLFVDFFSQTSGLVHSGAVPNPDYLAQVKGVEDDPLVKGKAIGIWQWTNQFIGLQQVAARPLEMQHMPGPDRTAGLYLKPSMYLSVSKNSKNKEEAAKFIDFFVNDIEANKLIKGDRGVPVSSKVKEALKPILEPAQVQVFDYVAWAETNSTPMDPPDPVGTAEIINIFKSYSEQMAFGQIKPEEAAKKFREEANAVLAKNK
ncbi:extracellular solute-binding protein [Paenibacillus sp. sptzw28]|uniref:ABC transporter substrate-binding protein n=1 Tax=Paenibacillus sp. sptzw28 TaxID=715179 RepID=UPI001C6E3066|nr:extracellular solute-binding protein [Paenibacillus sp. sptzw28]QYR19667.1 extracellular solute-binding protein [Paenibacillus sp. sptzw28]